MKIMKPRIALLLLTCAAAFATAPGSAAETANAAEAAAIASPAGTWKWSQPGRDGGSWEQTLKLASADGKLTGTLLGGPRPWGEAPDVAIGEGSFVDGVVAFSVTREFGGTRFVIRYEGKLEGDTITGTVERPGRDGGAARKREWIATRAK